MLLPRKKEWFITLGALRGMKFHALLGIAAARR